MYQTLTTTDSSGLEQTSIIRDNGNDQFTSFPADPENPNYAAYLAWVEAGNTPEPAPEPEPVPELTTEQKLEAAGLTVAELKELFGLN
jgi:hypothetical protein